MTDKETEKRIEEKYIWGKVLYFQGNAPMERRERGWEYLNEAYNGGHVDAGFMIGYVAFANPFSEELYLRRGDGTTTTLTRDMGWKMLWEAAAAGSVRAKNYLDQICEKPARTADSPAEPDHPERTVFRDYKGPLKDFDGKVIDLRKEGLRTPVDAVLKYEDGMNILDLSLNLQFIYPDPIGEEQAAFEKAVKEGIKAWEGTYEVFGGQKVTVRLHITEEDRLFDNVIVLAYTESYKKEMDKFVEKTKDVSFLKKKNYLVQNTAASTLAFSKWSATGRKGILLKPVTGSFADAEVMKDLTRHEFGHVLGLGDLYVAEGLGFEGVKPGTYYDLDPFYVSGGRYHLIMCDPRGIISGNDIEMVILAFSTNRMQLYQKGIPGGVISEALGRGN